MNYKMKCYSGDEPRIEVTAEFVEKNNLEIDVEAARKIIRTGRGFFDFQPDVAIEFLPYEEIKSMLTEEFIKKVESGECAHRQILDVMEAAQDFLDYMVFAWMKANDERGFSAGRSISKLSAWMKILSRPDIAEILENEDNFCPYGKPALRMACAELGIQSPEYI